MQVSANTVHVVTCPLTDLDEHKYAQVCAVDKARSFQEVAALAFGLARTKRRKDLSVSSGALRNHGVSVRAEQRNEDNDCSTKAKRSLNDLQIEEVPEDVCMACERADETICGI